MESRLSLNLIKNWQALCCEIEFADVAPLLLQNRVITVDEYKHIVSQTSGAGTENLLLLLLKKDEAVLSRFGECLVADYGWLAEKLNEGYVPEESRDEVDASPFRRLDQDNYVENEKDSPDISNDCHSYNSITKNKSLNNAVNNKHRNLQQKRIIKSMVKNRLRPKIDNAKTVVTIPTTELIKPDLNEEITDEVIRVVKRSPSVSKSWTTLAHSLGLTDRVNDIRCKVILYGEDMSMCVVYLIKDWLEMCPKVATLSKLIEILRREDFNRVADNLSDIRQA